MKVMKIFLNAFIGYWQDHAESCISHSKCQLIDYSKYIVNQSKTVSGYSDVSCVHICICELQLLRFGEVCHLVLFSYILPLPPINAIPLFTVMGKPVWAGQYTTYRFSRGVPYRVVWVQQALFSCPWECEMKEICIVVYSCCVAILS
jgi:hypothetical protein